MSVHLMPGSRSHSPLLPGWSTEREPRQGGAFRRKSDGGFALSFPAKTDRGGRRHAYVRPADDVARGAIEREILGQLGQREDAHDAVEEAR